jgi:acetylornithine/succinyldiaminopimelate/putrescine aminotransferase
MMKTHVKNFGPLQRFIKIAYDDLEACSCFKKPKHCSFLVEPFKGEAGVFVPRRLFGKKLCALRITFSLQMRYKLELHVQEDYYSYLW